MRDLDTMVTSQRIPPVSAIVMHLPCSCSICLTFVVAMVVMVTGSFVVTATVMRKIVMQFVNRFHGDNAEPDTQVGSNHVHQAETGGNTIHMDAQLLQYDV
jgi:hypothetical protein